MRNNWFNYWYTRKTETGTVFSVSLKWRPFHVSFFCMSLTIWLRKTFFIDWINLLDWCDITNKVNFALVRFVSWFSDSIQYGGNACVVAVSWFVCIITDKMKSILTFAYISTWKCIRSFTRREINWNIHLVVYEYLDGFSFGQILLSVLDQDFLWIFLHLRAIYSMNFVMRRNQELIWRTISAIYEYGILW